MHYGEYFFTKNGKPTIQLIDQRTGSILPPGADNTLGQRETLSELDIKQTRLMYKCKKCGRQIDASNWLPFLSEASIPANVKGPCEVRSWFTRPNNR